MNLNVLKKIVILVLILAVPGFCYYLLTAEGKNRYHPLQFFGPKVLAKTSHKFHGKVIPDTIYHTLSDFKLRDQDGNDVSFKNFEGKVFVANFFYTGCSGVCTLTNAYMDSLAKSYIKNKMVRFVSISVDPAHDSPAALKTYASHFRIPSSKWLFLTGDTSTIYPLARKGFLVDALQTGPQDFVYSNKLILIDQHKRIRGYYNGTSLDDITKLNDEIKVQIAEELRAIKSPEM